MKENNFLSTVSSFLRRRLSDILKKKGPQLVTTASMLLSVLLALASNKIYEILSGLFKDNVSPLIRTILIIILVVGTVMLFYFIASIAQYLEKRIFPESWDDRHMKSAFLHLRTLGSNRQASFQDSFCIPAQPPTDHRLVNELERCMQLTVNSCYEFFRNSFSDPNKLVDDIIFEVTFMTKSYKDGEITIPYSANKENRTPISMLQRKNNPNTFNDTETAKIYKMTRPCMILIEDTYEDKSYAEVYDGQKKRIRSSVVLPVLSHHNELLGTLVVHCNQAKFFKQTRYNFWRELLEMFSVELGYNKLMLDYYINSNQNLEKPF